MLWADQPGYPLYARCETPQEADQLVEAINFLPEACAALRVAMRHIMDLKRLGAYSDAEIDALRETLRHADTISPRPPAIPAPAKQKV